MVHFNMRLVDFLRNTISPYTKKINTATLAIAVFEVAMTLAL